VWELNTGISKGLVGHTDPIETLAISPDGQRIVSGDDNKIKIWGIPTTS
jgi:WD40 repeat protein